MLRFLRTRRRRALQLQQQQKDSTHLFEAFKVGARAVNSLEELVRAEGRKTWLVMRYMLENLTDSTSPDQELMWCPRSQDFIHVNSSVTSFPKREGFPGDMGGDFCYRGIVINNYVNEKLFIKNPLTKEYATIPLPDGFVKKSVYVNYTSSDAGFYVAPIRATPGRDRSFDLYSSISKKWGVCSSSFEDKEDKEHSLSDFLGAWMTGYTFNVSEKEREDLTLYNPVYDSWKSIPMPAQIASCARWRLHDYQGRLYALVYKGETRFKVLVYSEELRSWSSLCDWTEHRKPQSRLSAVRLRAEGPYVFGYLEGPDPPFFKIFDLDKLCWYHAEIPFYFEALAYTPTEYPVA